MKMAYLWFLLAVTTLWTGGAQAAGILTPHTAQYKVKISVVSGRLSTELRATKDGYVANHPSLSLMTDSDDALQGRQEAAA